MNIRVPLPAYPSPSAPPPPPPTLSPSASYICRCRSVFMSFDMAEAKIFISLLFHNAPSGSSCSCSCTRPKWTTMAAKQVQFVVMHVYTCSALCAAAALVARPLAAFVFWPAESFCVDFVEFNRIMSMQ